MGYLGHQSTFTGTQNNKRISVSANSGQVDFLPPGGYNINAIDVYRNGVKLVGQRDFVALDGVTVTLTQAANSGDIIEFVIYENFVVADVLNGDGDQVINGNLQIRGNVTATGNISANISTEAVRAGIATEAVRAGIATEAVRAGIATEAVRAGIASVAVSAGVATVANTLSANATGTNLNVSGIVTALQFSGNITGTAATFTGNVSIAGTLTYDDVTNVDSIGLVTARNGLQVTGGIATVTGQTNLANVSVSAASTFSGKINANSGIAFTGFLREGINIINGKLSSNTTINVDHSLVHYFTTTETTTAIPNFTSTAGINTDLSIGQTFSVNIITTAAAAGYSTGARIDAGATLPVLWNGGSDPSAGGSGGVDVYTFQVIKTGNATFTILGNKNNFA